jgi:hypothetical protein
MTPGKHKLIPAPYSRGPGVRRVYHPQRANHPRRVLAAEGEIVDVRDAETLHWSRYLAAGDVIEQPLAPEPKAEPAPAKRPKSE